MKVFQKRFATCWKGLVNGRCVCTTDGTCCTRRRDSIQVDWVKSF